MRIRDVIFWISATFWMASVLTLRVSVATSASEIARPASASCGVSPVAYWAGIGFILRKYLQ